IKGRGGVVVAQSPESAKFDSMPRSAIEAGFVDSVLPPAELAMEVARLCREARRLAPLPPQERGANAARPGAPQPAEHVDTLDQLLPARDAPAVLVDKNLDI